MGYRVIFGQNIARESAYMVRKNTNIDIIFFTIQNEAILKKEARRFPRMNFQNHSTNIFHFRVCMPKIGRLPDFGCVLSTHKHLV